MKWLLIVFTILIFKINYSQYCGFSGSQVCSPYLVDTSFNFNPSQENFPCIERGVPFNQSISFFLRTYSIPFGGQQGNVQIQSIDVDSIYTLPTGLCWSTNKANNYAVYGDTLCINFQGTTFDSIGQYTLTMDIFLE